MPPRAPSRTRLTTVSAALAWLALSWLPGACLGQTVGAVTSFTQSGPLVVSTWPADLKAVTNASLFSWRTNVLDPEVGRSVFRVTMATNFPWAWTNTSGKNQTVDAISMCALTGWDYLPPEIDEVRVRLKVQSGHFLLAAGAINLAFAPGDAYTDFRVLDESTKGWQTVRFSLNRHLIRNYRRSDFTKRLPYVSLTRWIQEPLQLYLFRPGHGDLLVDRVELVATGKGCPYPEPTAEQITQRIVVADFETEDQMARGFSYCTVPLDLNGPLPTNYVKPNPNTSGTITVAGKSIQWFLPPRRDWVAQSWNGQHSLEIRQRGYESYAFSGLRLPNPDGVNALQLTLRADHASTLTNLVLDFLAYTAPPESRAAFPWTNCIPNAAWSADTNLNFDQYLSETNSWRESYAIYHARRSVPNGQWVQLTLPLADFAALYATREATNLFRFDQPLQSTNLLFLGLLSPYRQLKAETRIWVDDVSLVQVNTPAAQLRSFWQNPAVGSSQLVALTNYLTYYGYFRQRDYLPTPPTLGLIYASGGTILPVAASPGQRYVIHASSGLNEWRSVFTGYVDSSEEPFLFSEAGDSWFFKVVTD